jgi:hypothetical protein
MFIAVSFDNKFILQFNPSGGILHCHHVQSFISVSHRPLFIFFVNSQASSISTNKLSEGREEAFSLLIKSKKLEKKMQKLEENFPNAVGECFIMKKIYKVAFGEEALSKLYEEFYGTDVNISCFDVTRGLYLPTDRSIKNNLQDFAKCVHSNASQKYDYSNSVNEDLQKASEIFSYRLGHDNKPE